MDLQQKLAERDEESKKKKKVETVVRKDKGLASSSTIEYVVLASEFNNGLSIVYI